MSSSHKYLWFLFSEYLRESVSELGSLSLSYYFKLWNNLKLSKCCHSHWYSWNSGWNSGLCFGLKKNSENGNPGRKAFIRFGKNCSLRKISSVCLDSDRKYWRKKSRFYYAWIQTGFFSPHFVVSKITSFQFHFFSFFKE